MEIVGWVVGLALGAYALLRLAARVASRRFDTEERRGDRVHGTGGGAPLPGHWVLAPDKQHPVYTRHAEDVDEVEPGAPPDPGADP